jgi:hypothetical protein
MGTREKGSSLLLAMVLACEASGDRETRVRQDALAAELGNIDMGNGISQQEARLIADAYFRTFVAGCGFAEEPRSAGDTWESVPRVGYSGEPLLSPIRIDARTGAANLPGCPTMRTIQQLRDVIRSGGHKPDIREWPACWHALWPSRKKAG